jgi:hypothetical protein
MKAGIILYSTLAGPSFASAPFTLQEQAVSLERIAPKQMQAEFSQEDSTKAWTDHLYSPSNKKIYVLSLKPEVNLAKNVIGVDLVLRDAEKPKTDENLLSPAGIWHGLQPYNFVATDLILGADRSAFGARRSIKVRSRKLNVIIQILAAKIIASPDGTQEIDVLKLAISVDNLPNF